MTDRELLELAAKAARVPLWKYGDPWRDGADSGGLLHAHGRSLWNPLTDDGDALRLAVKLMIDIRLFERFDSDHMDCLVDRMGKGLQERRGDDPYLSLIHI